MYKTTHGTNSSLYTGASVEWLSVDGRADAVSLNKQLICTNKLVCMQMVIVIYRFRMHHKNGHACHFVAIENTVVHISSSRLYTYTTCEREDMHSIPRELEFTKKAQVIFFILYVAARTL